MTFKIWKQKIINTLCRQLWRLLSILKYIFWWFLIKKRKIVTEYSSSKIFLAKWRKFTTTKIPIYIHFHSLQVYPKSILLRYCFLTRHFSHKRFVLINPPKPIDTCCNGNIFTRSHKFPSQPRWLAQFRV
jgi:hypothetical protein